MEEYPSNRHKDKDAEAAEKTPAKRVSKVTTGAVVQRKKPLGKKFMETFFGGEDVDSVVKYVIGDVLIPAAKDTISDAISQGIERILFGEGRSTRRQSGYRTSGSSGYTSYNRMSSNPTKRREREEPREISRRSRSSHDFDEIILATRAEAEEVIDRLFDLVSRYDQATVSDLYELVGVTGSFTDEKWGWSDIRGAGVSKIRGGYLLDLPRPEPLRD